MSKIPLYHIEQFSKPIFRIDKVVPILKNNDYCMEDSLTVNGDAPKKLIRIYSYNKSNKFKKKQVKRWPLYIAKTGHKWYPMESITEYLLNKLGVCFGLNMAESSIMLVGGQVRFLSKYFLSKNEQLVHGAEIFAGYLGDDKFVEQIEAEKLARDMFTLQFIEKSLKHSFPYSYKNILHELVRLILFDALVGNNDRHYFNWGVITSVRDNTPPKFAPIYDTARGLLWNMDEPSLQAKTSDKQFLSKYLIKYCKNSRPKIGWEGEKDINHFSLVKFIYQNEFYISKEEMKALFCDGLIEKMLLELNNNFSIFFTPFRLDTIQQCLIYRFQTIKSFLV